MTADTTETYEVTTFANVNEGDVIRMVDGEKTADVTVVRINHAGDSLLPIAIRLGLLTYAYDNERDAEVTVVSRANEKEEPSQSEKR